AVGRVAVPLTRRRGVGVGRVLAAVALLGVVVGAVGAGGDVGGQELFGHGRVGVVGPGGLGQLFVGDDAGVGFGDHVGPVPVPAGLGRLAGVPRLRVHNGDNPVLSDLTGDAPPPVGAVGTL